MGGAYKVQLPLSGLQIFPEQATALESILVDIKGSAKAELVLLTDRSGQCISYIGSSLQLDLAALGSLLAGHMASAEEIARLLDDAHQREVLVREGKRYNLLSSHAGEHLLLLVLSGKDIPLGWARVCVLKGIEMLAEVPLQALEGGAERHEVQDLAALDEQIDQALGGLWLEGNVHQLGEE